MRILVLQLARFGDVYQTWPTVNALKRLHPEAEIHVLVRARFREALTGLSGVVQHQWPTAEILEPIYLDGDEVKANDRLVRVLDKLASNAFTRVINLSFSPLSSYVADYLKTPGVRINGYGRHADGFFNPSDDHSAYFYAQVGIDRANRYHVTELFAGVAGVELIDADFNAHVDAPAAAAGRRGVVVHLGASQIDKTYPTERWAEVLTEFRRRSNEPITLIGSPAERALAEAVATTARITDVENIAGRTNVGDLRAVIANARLLIGADSAPVHVAALTNTPVLNLSGDAVNFYETGPLNPGSVILREVHVADIPPARIADAALAMLNGAPFVGPGYVRESRATPPSPVGLAAPDAFAWDLIQALYVGTPYPATAEPADLLAFQRLHEIAELALEQLRNWDGAGQSTAAHQLSMIDTLIPEVARISPRIEPLTQYFQTQRLRIAPGEPAEVLAATRAAFEDLRVISSVYLTPAPLEDTVRRAVTLGRDIAPALRECDFARVEGQFNELISVLQSLAARSTKVGTASWSALVPALGNALVARDFIELADRLEYELPRELKTLVPDVLL